MQLQHLCSAVYSTFMYFTMSSVAPETFLKLVLSHGYMNTISSELLLPHPVGQASGNGMQRECCQAGSCCSGVEIVTEKMDSMTTDVDREQVSAADYAVGDGTSVR